MTQVCGVVLAAEFLYVAYSNIFVSMSTKGVLIGMSFAPWQRFATHSWIEENNLELRTRSEKRYRFKIPDEVKTNVDELVNQNILK